MTARTAESEFRFEASAEDAGSRLDAFLAARMSAMPLRMTRARVQRLIDEGRVRLDGAVAKSSARLKSGSIAQVRVPPPKASGVLAQKIPLAVLFEDADVIVVDKPAGLAVHPGAGRDSGTLVNALLAHTPLASVGDVLRPGIVHRLDKDTSGVMVAAKSDLAHQSLSKQFHDHTIERAYVALAWGRFPDHLDARERIGRDPQHRVRFAAFPEASESGRRAVTHAKRVAVLGPASLVECRLETGRTHQIRVHLAHHGHPLVGDPLYGRAHAPAGTATPLKTLAESLARQMLHAQLLGFEHPRSGRRVSFHAPVPADMEHVIDAFRREEGVA